MGSHKFLCCSIGQSRFPRLNHLPHCSATDSTNANNHVLSAIRGTWRIIHRLQPHRHYDVAEFAVGGGPEQAGAGFIRKA